MTTMAEPPAADALDVRTFLLGDKGPEALRAELSDALSEMEDKGLAKAVSGPARKVLDEELAEVAAGFLDVDLGATAVAGWRLHRQLIAAAQETQRTPGLTQRVPLARHTMTSTWKPRVEVQLGPASLAHLSLEVRVTFVMVGLSATVHGGRLMRLGGGSGTVSARLSLGGHPLVERTAPFDARVSVPLGAGIPLWEIPEPRDAPSVIELPDATTSAGASTP